jgi:DNA-binding XRE family transcriptional regulator
VEEDFLEKLQTVERNESADIASALALLDGVAKALGGTNALAKKLGVTRSAIGKWRAGVTRPTAKNARKINMLAEMIKTMKS